MWLGCDGRWFLNVAERYGYEEANELNKRVNRSLTRASMRKLVKVAGWDRPSDMDALKEMLETGYEVYHPPPECEIELQVLNGQTLRALFHRCPVMEKVERGGGMDNYRCACPLSFEGWIEALGLAGEARIEQGPEQGPPCEVLITVVW
jgi:hypothetical protein